MMKRIPPLARAPVLILGLFCALNPLSAQPDPQTFLTLAKSNPGLRNSTGEQFAWYANFRARYFVDAYLAYGDTAWLEAAEDYFDFIIEEGISLDPDGYPGVIGALIGTSLDDPGVNVLYDALVGDALIASHITRFAEVVIDRPDLHGRFLDTAEGYVALATEMLWEKWNARGTYHVDSRGFGSYFAHPFGIDRADPSRWVAVPQRQISENLNKQYEAAVTLLRLYRITGNPDYRQRVMEIFSRAKAMFRLFPGEDRVVWNFWMPHGRWDLSGTIPASWVGIHSSRSFYQNIESRIFLEVYNSGLVFDETDIIRMVNTNLWMMDNGFRAPDNSSSAGELWDGLAQVAPRIRDAYEVRLTASTSPENVISLAYLRNVIDPIAGMDRRYVDDPAAVEVADIPAQPGVEQIMALPIPDRIETINNDSIRLILRAARSGTVTVDLLSADGTFLGNIDSGSVSGQFHSIAWDGTHPVSGEKEWGEYLVRWTLNGESRTWPVVVEEGEERPPEIFGRAIRPGQTLRYDFESPLGDRWTLAGADITTVRSFSGAQSLRLGRRGRADLLFGNPGMNMPIIVEFMAYDGGALFGSEIIDGAMWGTRGSDDNLFVFAQRWRPFLAGDTNLNWINSGQNQLFSVWFMPLTRVFGWSHWSFDYTNYPDPPIIKRDGVAIDNAWITDRGPWLPLPAIGAVFFGPDVGGPALANALLYIDDVVITHTGAPVSVFSSSPFSENFGGGWKINDLGIFYDSAFPWVYSPALESWLYMIGFTEIEGYYFWIHEEGVWAHSRVEAYPWFYRYTDEGTAGWSRLP
ncbi:MAG: hypothetical protein JJT96_09640 [Opitutales bacterium]|nr:hypothetical protein [Opitutales bacterium]